MILSNKYTGRYCSERTQTEANWIAGHFAEAAARTKSLQYIRLNA